MQRLKQGTPRSLGTKPGSEQVLQCCLPRMQQLPPWAKKTLLLCQDVGWAFTLGWIGFVHLFLHSCHTVMGKLGGLPSSTREICFRAQTGGSGVFWRPAFPTDPPFPGKGSVVASRCGVCGLAIWRSPLEDRIQA